LARSAKSEFDVEWFEHLPCAITVCDKKYRILYMNGRSADVNKKAGGRALIGRNLMDCHPPEAQNKLREVMASGKPYAFTAERRGVKKMVYQSHWRRNGRVAGIVELYFELPKKLPNLQRK
jgi:transcriptional regulator with PAS, ATPase and Fis domain